MEELLQFWDMIEGMREFLHLVLMLVVAVVVRVLKVEMLQIPMTYQVPVVMELHFQLLLIRYVFLLPCYPHLQLPRIL